MRHYTSDLRRAVMSLVTETGLPSLGHDLPRARGRRGAHIRVRERPKSDFAGDLYFWWEAHKAEYPSLPLYDEWRQRDFSRNVAMKMYESAVTFTLIRPGLLHVTIYDLDNHNKNDNAYAGIYLGDVVDLR